MRCSNCGATAEEIGDPNVESLNFGANGLIEGIVTVKTKCERCGSSATRFDVEIDIQVPTAHRSDGHELEIEFESLGAGTRGGGFPVKVRCSCGKLDRNGILNLHRGN